MALNLQFRHQLKFWMSLSSFEMRIIKDLTKLTVVVVFWLAVVQKVRVLYLVLSELC